ncbi:MAG: hypothetical protein KZQ83_04100 [gamma proteobacterium symbiont of Taylorina sp.]|nr:hypothetical protein [gamma proteobacterium symbiont of Taylorina sp.]
MKINYSQQKGVSLVGAIFIVVALASIGAAMVTLSGTTATTSVLNIEQQRAYYTARSGMEWAIKTVLDTDSTSTASCTNISGVSFTSNEGFTITVDACTDCASSGGSCCDESTTPGSCTINPRVTTIKITAEKGNNGDIYHVSRSIQTTTSYDGP